MLIFVLGFVLGLVLGSLILCLANRSLTKESFWGRSYCDNCKKQLNWYDLFPVLSYLFLKGKCRFCKNKITIEALLVEILAGLIIGLLFYLYIPLDLITNPGLNTLARLADVGFYTFTISILMICFITDIKTGLIPDRITYPSVVVAMVSQVSLVLLKTALLYQSLNTNTIGRYLLPPYSDYFFRQVQNLAWPLIGSYLLGAVALGLFFGGLIFFTRGRGMGGGDLKLGIFMGLALGFNLSVLAVFSAFLLGSIVGIGLLISRFKHFGQTIPFGPFLAIGGIVAVFYGHKIISWYSNYLLSSGSIF